MNYEIRIDDDASNERLDFVDNEGNGYTLMLLDKKGICIKTDGEINFELIEGNKILIYSNE